MIIPVLHNEKEVQLKDLTRFDASKSILVKGSVDPINAVKIKPGADATEVDVFDTDYLNWYLDFAFNSYAFDVGIEHNKVNFKVAGTEYEAVISNGTYTLTNLLAAIKAAMEAEASPLTVAFVVDSKNRITLTPSLPLEILLNKSPEDLFKHLNFQDGSLVSLPVEYGLRKVTLTIETASESASVFEYVKVYTEEGDNLFSSDADLTIFEKDIMKWLSVGKSSYKDVHRRAQRLILDYLAQNGFKTFDDRNIGKWDILKTEQLNKWSYYLVLHLLFSSFQNDTDDVFKEKASMYEKYEIAARSLVELSLDTNQDGKEDKTERVNVSSGTLRMG